MPTTFVLRPTHRRVIEAMHDGQWRTQHELEDEMERLGTKPLLPVISTALVGLEREQILESRWRGGDPDGTPEPPSGPRGREYHLTESGRRAIEEHIAV